MRGNAVRGEETCKNHVRLYVEQPYGKCWIHVSEYSVNARLDCWIWSQNCRNTLPWHKCSTSECTKWDAVMAGRDELSENPNLLLGLAYDGTIMWNEDFCTRSRTENGC